MTFDAGDLILVPFPFTDLSSTKRRPALVISDASFNQREDIIVCAVTSNLANADRSVLVSQRNMKKGRIAVQSRIKATKVATLHHGLVVKKVGAVQAEILARVYDELDAALAR